MFEITEDINEFDKVLSWLDSFDIQKYYNNIIVIKEDRLYRYKRTEIEALFSVHSYRKVAEADFIVLVYDDGTEKVLKDRYRLIS